MAADRFQRDFEITNEIQLLIDTHGENYVEKIFYEKFCTQVFNSFKNKLNLTIDVTTSTKQVINQETGILDTIPINIFRFECDKISIKKKLKKENVNRKHDTTPNSGNTPSETNNVYKNEVN